jgi:hypothetical protein
MCVRHYGLGKLTEKQESRTLQKKIVSKMDERRKWMNVNNEGRNTYQKTGGQIERATDKSTMEYF